LVVIEIPKGNNNREIILLELIKYNIGLDDNCKNLALFEAKGENEKKGPF